MRSNVTPRLRAHSNGSMTASLTLIGELNSAMHRLGQNGEKFRLLGVELEHVCPHPAQHCSDPRLQPADDLMHRESVGDTELQEDLCIISIEVKVNTMFPQQGGQL